MRCRGFGKRVVRSEEERALRRASAKAYNAARILEADASASAETVDAAWAQDAQVASRVTDYLRAQDERRRGGK